MPARTTIKDSLRLCPRMGDMRRRGGGKDGSEGVREVLDGDGGEAGRRETARRLT